VGTPGRQAPHVIEAVCTLCGISANRREMVLAKAVIPGRKRGYVCAWCFWRRFDLGMIRGRPVKLPPRPTNLLP